jgi:hypothetical protein
MGAFGKTRSAFDLRKCNGTSTIGTQVGCGLVLVQCLEAVSGCAMRAKGKSIFLAGLALVLIGAAVLWATRSQVSQKPLATVALGDGRILQLEAVTYGTTHHIGNPASEVGWRLNAWLPGRLRADIATRNPESAIDDLEIPALVVWVNALSAQTGTNVDCQRIRVELVNERGEHYAADNSYWFGGTEFWRVGHVFPVFPRSQTKLTLQVTAWKIDKTNQMEFPNPHVVQPAAWTGMELPQQKQAADLNIVLTGLRLRTNGVPSNYWETRSVYWEPMWELRHGNEKIGGWEEPEWFAEDPTGNRGQHLGTYQSVLRFSGTFYPAATNIEVAHSLARLPQTIVTNLQTILWWNQTVQYQANNISILGLFPAGNYVFNQGAFLTNPPVSMGPVRGGAPSGWTGQQVAVNPLKVVSYHGHYSTIDSVIYVSAPKLGGKTRLAMRLRDDQGRYWLAQPEPQGAIDGVYPFLVDLPPGVNRVTPELVVLTPVEAEFMVKVPAPAIP